MIPLKDKKTLDELIDGNFAEGHEILDVMLMASEDPDADLTDREKMRLLMLRFLVAAVTEAANRARTQFDVHEIELAQDMWACAGEAIASFNFQAFSFSTPRAEKVIRKSMKDCLMAGHDHFLQMMQKANAAQH